MQISLILLLISSLTVAFSTTLSPDFDFKISSIHKLLREKSKKCTEIVEFFFQRSMSLNSRINALNTLNKNAINEARELDSYFSTHQNQLKGPLHCIPVLIKDNIDVAGLPTTGGINALRNSTPQASASLVQSLRNAGAIIIAKANMAEMAMGARYASEIGGACRNPYDLTRTCGASSSGSGAGVSAGMAPISLGSDTDGSIMNPASYCGLYGLRPPTKALSSQGVLPLFSKQDTVGPMAKHLDDLVLTYSVLKQDETIYKQYLNGSTSKKYRILYLNNFFEPFNVSLSAIGATFSYYLDSAVNESMRVVMQNMAKLNLELVKVTLNESLFKNFTKILAKIVEAQLGACAPCLFTVDLNAYFSQSGPNVAFRSIDEFLHSPILSDFWKSFFEGSNVFDLKGVCAAECVDYVAAVEEFRSDYLAKWFDFYGADVAVLPTISNLAEKIDEIDEMRVSSTFLASYSGFAALNVPIGFSAASKSAPDGLPIGLTLLAPPHNLEHVFKVAKLYSDAFVRVKITPTNLKSGAPKFHNFKINILAIFCIFKLF